ETDNAFVKADKVPVSAEVAGAVVEVPVAENERVQAGQTLFRLDPAPFRVAVARAEAGLAQASTDIDAMKASYREKQAQIALAQTRAGFARREEARQADLAARRFVSPSRLDDARQAAELAQQDIVAQQRDLQRIATALGGSVDVPVQDHPAWRAALAELERTRLDLSRVEVRASIGGTVSNLPKPGQFVAVGATVAALVADARPWIEANFPEKELTWVRPGQPAEVRIDTYPDRRWTGIVDSLSPATGAEFSILPPQNASGNWVKIAQRIPVRIRLDPQPDAPMLRAGSSATVRIDTGHRRSLFGFSL
ncbi:MAG TPA: HlyD family secretion protein, partial [Burkholderiaceae bacterium]|nr:HlyD family secretion protein [Burkholderiaceae bacterium]